METLDSTIPFPIGWQAFSRTLRFPTAPAKRGRKLKASA
jgi:hypothetical protein